MKLTLRFYEPTAGRVLLDGTPLHGMSNAELRSQVAWVPQEPPLFPVSVREVRVRGRGSNPTPTPTPNPNPDQVSGAASRRRVPHSSRKRRTWHSSRTHTGRHT